MLCLSQNGWGAALHLAAVGNRAEIVRMLTNSKADLMVGYSLRRLYYPEKVCVTRSQASLTTFEAACRKGHTNVVEFLVTS